MWFLWCIAMLVLRSLSSPTATVPENFSRTPGCTTTSIVFPVGCDSLTTTVHTNTIITTTSIDCHGCCKIQLYPLGHCFLPMTYPTTVTAATPTTQTRTVCVQSSEASCQPTPGAPSGNSTTSTGTHLSINSTFKITPDLPPKKTTTRLLPPGVATESPEPMFTTVGYD